MSFKFKVEPSVEKFAGKIPDWDDPHIKIPLEWSIFGKQIKINVDFYLNEDGSMNPKVVDHYNKFFVNLEKVIKSKMSMILKEVPYDPEPNFKMTEQYLVQHFRGLTSCFVKQDDTLGTVAHVSFEWSPEGKNYDIPLDIEHGNGFAMVNGTIKMGKPGDFY